MYHFLLDAWAVLRMRFKPQDEYRYSLPVVIAILAALTLINASALGINSNNMLQSATELQPAGEASLLPIFSSHIHLILTALAFTILKLVVLCFSLQKVLGYFGSNKLQLMGFIFITEALMIPEILLIYAPSLAIVGIIWQFWTFLVQINGVVYFSGLPPFRVVIGYIAYFVLMLFSGVILAAILTATGLINLDAAINIVELLQKSQ